MEPRDIGTEFVMLGNREALGPIFALRLTMRTVKTLRTQIGSTISILCLLSVMGAVPIAALAENSQCVSIFQSDDHALKSTVLKKSFELGAKNFDSAERTAQMILALSEREQNEWLGAIGEIYRQIPKKNPNPLAQWSIGGRRLLDRILTRTERVDMKFASEIKNKSAWQIFREIISKRQMTFHSHYTADELGEIVETIQARLALIQVASPSPVTILLSGSVVNGKGSQKNSDLDLSISDPSLARYRNDFQSDVDSILSKNGNGSSLELEFHTEPAAFYGQLNSVVIQITANDVHLLVYPPALLMQDRTTLRSQEPSRYAIPIKQPVN